MSALRSSGGKGIGVCGRRLREAKAERRKYLLQVDNKIFDSSDFGLLNEEGQVVVDSWGGDGAVVVVEVEAVV